jgi:hypothetical protein
MRKPTAIIALSVLLLLLVGAGVYSYFSPQFTLKGIRDAAKARDADRLRDLIDFEAVRDGLKEDLKTLVSASADQDLKDNPFSVFGFALAGTMIDPIVNALVNPSIIARIVSQGDIELKPVPNKTRGRSVESEPRGIEPAAHPVIIEKGYDGISRYRVTIRSAEAEPEDALCLILRRESLFTWKLCRIILPKSFFNEHKD